jgi:hypothetical protein
LPLLSKNAKSIRAKVADRFDMSVSTIRKYNAFVVRGQRTLGIYTKKQILLLSKSLTYAENRPDRILGSPSSVAPTESAL